MSNPVTDNPNAAVGGISGIGGGILVVYVLGLLGVDVDQYAAAAIAGAVSTIALFIGKNGIKGALGIFWRGRTA